MIRMVNKSALDQSMPKGFSFYHLGRVEPVPADPKNNSRADREAVKEQIRDTSVVAFQVYTLNDQQRNLLVASFERSLDDQAHIELGNTVASILATNLGKELDEDVLISAPIITNDEYILKVLDSNNEFQIYPYMLNNEKLTLSINVLFFPFRPQMERFHV